MRALEKMARNVVVFAVVRWLFLRRRLRAYRADSDSVFITEFLPMFLLRCW